MFNNLIESSSHRSEFRRRGSFFLFTTTGYALLFVIAGVASIYAYDARMEDQTFELATIMRLVDLPAPETTAAEDPKRITGPKSNADPRNYYVRKTPMATVDNSQLAPIDINTKPSDSLPMPPRGIVRLGAIDANPSEPGGSKSGEGGMSLGAKPNPLIAISEPPPAQPVRKPPVISKGVITSEALALPKPPYPEMAKQMRLQGKVTIQVLIDETGKVISARVLDGHPFFKQVSERAAYQARFSPTRLGDQPVKVSGVISYNFVLQ